MFDGEAFGAEIVAHVRSHVANSIAPLGDKIIRLEAQLKFLSNENDKLRAQMNHMSYKFDTFAEVPGPPGRDGKDADIAVIAKMIADEIGKIPPAPAGKDGESIVGPPGPPGKDTDPEAIWNIVNEIVAAEIAKIPPPKPGKDGESIVGPPGPAGPPGESIVGPPGCDGVGIASSFIDRDGNLVLTFTDGTVGSVGKVVGGQGPPGINGIDGKDGRDGFGFDDIQVAMLEDGHTLQVKFVRGEAVKIFPVVLPNTKYCGVWIEDKEYMVGDMVTWAGSLWHCNAITKDRPGLGCPHWTLATKKGRDGRDGKDGSSGPPGPIGPRGRDLTQMDFSGAKF